MRRPFAVALMLALVGSTTPAAWQVGQPTLLVHFTRGGGMLSDRVLKTAIHFGVSGGIAAHEPKPGSAIPPELTFELGTWKEGDKARVVVYAALSDKRAPEGKTRTPISTFLIGPNESREVKEAHAWGAPGLVVSASLER